MMREGSGGAVMEMRVILEDDTEVDDCVELVVIEDTVELEDLASYSNDEVVALVRAGTRAVAMANKDDTEEDLTYSDALSAGYFGYNIILCIFDRATPCCAKTKECRLGTGSSMGNTTMPLIWRSIRKGINEAALASGGINEAYGLPNSGQQTWNECMHEVGLSLDVGGGLLGEMQPMHGKSSSPSNSPMHTGMDKCDRQEVCVGISNTSNLFILPSKANREIVYLINNVQDNRYMEGVDGNSTVVSYLGYMVDLGKTKDVHDNTMDCF
ncbi:hypothetical protein TanjilG_16456 [Lupinus angustifolius]|uniref:Uncharacterized protein n=1 Tax=Lupinus angustifolius TaxID=3871 RepID=A0A1J7HA29_LUPAN|nr:hypothetical protein TanjilG_16455 [Lupinus angustifolius]OIW03307.1 hypothetical protein TanjilG_16456 [Lupinus angustifolius]